MKTTILMACAGALAGVANGIFGAGGGMLLVPLLGFFRLTDDDETFPTSVSIITPICLASLLAGPSMALPWSEARPYLLGGALGGIAAGLTGKKIPVKWLHRILGIFILWGGIKYLC